MAEENKRPKLWRTSYFWKSITPLLLTLAVIGYVNVAEPKAAAVQPTQVAIATTVPRQATPQQTAMPPTLLPATILPSPTPSQTPQPAVPTAAAITLLGPPTESAVLINGRLSFYWRYSETLLPGQQMVFTLSQNDAPLVTVPISEPTLGDTFQLLLDFTAFEDAESWPGTAVWQVHLERASEQTPLLSSEARLLIFLPGN